jgi:alkylation response protein AidB-like acyl-CoA dehydrogenase
MHTANVSQQLTGLLPAIRRRRAEIEQARRMPRDLIDDLSKTGLFSLSVPRAIGGQEASPFDILQAIESIAAADGSTGWCAMIGVGNNLGRLSERGRGEGRVRRSTGALGRHRGAGRDGGA